MGGNATAFSADEILAIRARAQAAKKLSENPAPKVESTVTETPDPNCSESMKKWLPILQEKVREKTSFRSQVWSP